MPSFTENRKLRELVGQYDIDIPYSYTKYPLRKIYGVPGTYDIRTTRYIVRMLWLMFVFVHGPKRLKYLFLFTHFSERFPICFCSKEKHVLLVIIGERSDALMVDDRMA